MVQRVKHPRTMAAVRVGLSLVAALLGVGLAGVALASLLLVFVFGSVALALGGDVNLLAVAGLVALVVVVSVGLLWSLFEAVGRIEAAIREADREPDPVALLREQYVTDEIDERELERALDELLADSEGERSDAELEVIRN
jgi:uncharacterized membrane protein